MLRRPECESGRAPHPLPFSRTPPQPICVINRPDRHWSPPTYWVCIGVLDRKWSGLKRQANHSVPSTAEFRKEWRRRLRLKCDGTRAETRFRLSAKRTSLFKSAGASVQSTTGSLRPLACWDLGFESHRGHGYLSVVSVVCCQVEVPATSWSLVHRSPTDCAASLCVV